MIRFFSSHPTFQYLLTHTPQWGSTLQYIPTVLPVIPPTNHSCDPTDNSCTSTIFDVKGPRRKEHTMVQFPRFSLPTWRSKSPVILHQSLSVTPRSYEVKQDEKRHKSRERVDDWTSDYRWGRYKVYEVTRTCPRPSVFFGCWKVPEDVVQRIH